MRTWGHTGRNEEDGSPTLCGSAGCIAGWAYMAQALEGGGGQFKAVAGFGFTNWKSGRQFDLAGAEDMWFGSSAGRIYLGMDEGDDREKSHALFHAYGLPGGTDFFAVYDAEPEEQKAAVLAVLDHLIETGEVDWRRAVERTIPRLIRW